MNLVFLRMVVVLVGGGEGGDDSFIKVRAKHLDCLDYF